MGLTIVALLLLTISVALWRTGAFDEGFERAGLGLPAWVQHLGNIVVSVIFLVIALLADFG